MMYYFGCREHEGHYWWEGKRKVWNTPEDCPWPHVDGNLSNKNNRSQGVASLNHKDGWTALDVHDYTVDSRGNSHSVFVIDEDLTFTQILDKIGLMYPDILKRIGGIRLMNNV